MATTYGTFWKVSRGFQIITSAIRWSVFSKYERKVEKVNLTQREKRLESKPSKLTIFMSQIVISKIALLQ